jgi:hypothetical protein
LHRATRTLKTHSQLHRATKLQKPISVAP